MMTALLGFCSHHSASTSLITSCSPAYDLLSSFFPPIRKLLSDHSQNLPESVSHFKTLSFVTTPKSLLQCHINSADLRNEDVDTCSGLQPATIIHREHLGICLFRPNTERRGLELASCKLMFYSSSDISLPFAMSSSSSFFKTHSQLICL